MNLFRADLHIHTLLSPCGSLDMSPATIVQIAKEKGLDIIGITDHNSTRHGKLIHSLAKQNGIVALCGAEVTTREEVHCLAFFEDFERLDLFQDYLWEHLVKIKNVPEKFGYQPVIDENEDIVEMVEALLIQPLTESIEAVQLKVNSLGGIFIPAHVNRPMNGILSQLGFIPSGLNCDALEISCHISREDFLRQNPVLEKYRIIQSSDAHYPEQIGHVFTNFLMYDRSFAEIKMALAQQEGRNCLIP